MTVDSYEFPTYDPMACGSKGYSRLRHLVNALRGIHDPERTLVSVLTAPQLTGYFDASGSPKEGTILTVAGFISFETRWLQFEEAWTPALEKEHVTCFHMHEFIKGKNEFEGWKQTRRERFITALGKIVAANVVLSSASTIVLEDWNEANRQYKLVEYDYHPYVIASWSCVDHMLDWAKDHLYAPPLFIFEHGDKHQLEMKRCIEKDFGLLVDTRIKRPQKNKPNEVPVIQLQSADFAAWQLLNTMREHHVGNLPQYTVEPWLWQAFARLFISVKYDHTHFSLTARPQHNRTGDWRELQILREPSLIRFAKERGVPKR